jgi:cytosine/adenosine deaminase-related metal-dependent hydrolase
MRCHVDIDPEFGLRHVEAMQQLQDKYRDLIDLQLVVFPQTGLISRPGTAELMREAMALGVENVGGLDPAASTTTPSPNSISCSNWPASSTVGWTFTCTTKVNWVCGKSR